MTGIDNADRDDDRLTRVCLPRNRLINERYKMRRDRNGINCRVRSSAVTAAPRNFYREIFTERSPRTGSNHHFADGKVWVNMKRNDRIDPFKGAFLDHFTRTATRLFGRLKNASPSHWQWPRPIESKSCPEKDRGMRIVAAGVHHARSS